MNLLYITFGSHPEIYYQANFSVLSFLKEKQHIDSITIITDKLEFYKNLAEHINLIPITPETLIAWRGKHDFLWRIKIKALELLALQLGEIPIVYLDTDTFLMGDAEEFRKQLGDAACMNVNEGPISALKTKTERKMWKQIKDRTFGGITISKECAMWNAGVVAIPGQNNLKAISLALSICDDMCEQNVERRLVEQVALSVALAEFYILKPSDIWIGHYWGNKPGWNNAITKFFIDNHLQGLSLEEEIEIIKTFDFFSLPLFTKRSRMHARWIKWIDKLFTPKKIIYAIPSHQKQGEERPTLERFKNSQFE
jgi:hypothetical protein